MYLTSQSHPLFECVEIFSNFIQNYLLSEQFWKLLVKIAVQI